MFHNAVQFDDDNIVSGLLPVYHSSEAAVDSNEMFLKALAYLEAGEWDQANELLSQITYSSDRFSVNYSMSLSLLGLTEAILFGSNGGMHRCYEALNETSEKADLYFHIAYGEFILGHRSRCVKALEQCKEHKFAKQFQACIGERKKLRKKRDSVFQKTVVKLFRKTNHAKVREKCTEILSCYLSSKLTG